MEKRERSVSEAQWQILLDFLEQNPILARSRGYNNSAQGRQQTSRLWVEVANLLNAEGTGVTKTPKDWSIYVSNYKSKLKKVVADINTDLNATGGGSPTIINLPNTEQRFLSIMGQGFGHNAQAVRVLPLPDVQDQSQSSSSGLLQGNLEDILQIVVIDEGSNAQLHNQNPDNINRLEATAAPQYKQAGGSGTSPTPHEIPTIHQPRQTRQRRYRSRPLAPIDEARRILSQVEIQRAAADTASAEAEHLIAVNIGRLATTAERYLSFIGSP